MSRIGDLGKFYGKEQDLVDVDRAARYAGAAGAMVANLHNAGSSERAALWQAEHEAWLARRDEVIEQAPLGGHYLSVYAAETICATFTEHVVTPGQLAETMIA